MNKSILVAAITTAIAFSGATFAKMEKTTGMNGVTIDLAGTFYHPNESQILQESTPIVEFDGLTKKGGQDIVAGYIKTFGQDVMGHAIGEKLKEIGEKLTKDQRDNILANKKQVAETFPELIEFYSGLGLATGYSENEVYLAAWASDGLFAMNIQDVAKSGLAALKEATSKTRGCTAIGWTNGVLGQNQDMPVSLGGYGAIWKSGSVIVHAPEPLFTSIAMGKELATTANTVDAFQSGALDLGVPVSGVLMAMANKFDDAMEAKNTLDNIEVNSAYATSFADKKGQVVTVENQLGNNVVHDGTVKGYITHTNHPLGQEQALVNLYANGSAGMFDYAIKTTLWRNEVAESHAKFSPERSVDALKDIFKQKPLMKAPYEGNAFVTTNSIIHDLNEGCTYGTTWLPSLQDYTKVCFGK